MIGFMQREEFRKLHFRIVNLLPLKIRMSIRYRREQGVRRVRMPHGVQLAGRSCSRDGLRGF